MSFKTDKNIIIDTGNIFKFGIIQRKGLNNVNVEVIDGIESVLNLSTNNSANWVDIELSNGKIIKCLQRDGNESKDGTNCHDNSIENHDRSKLKLSIKLFLYNDNDEDNDGNNGDDENSKFDDRKRELINESIEIMEKILNFKQIDNLILSIQTDDMDNVLPQLKIYWKLIEPFVTDEKIRQIGTSDLNYQQLFELYNWTDKIKPTSTQINLETCCDIPADLSKFAKENSIQLLTHNDPVDNFIPIELLRKLFKEKNESCPLLGDGQQLKRNWIARYTFTLPGQGVVLTKGYILSLLV